MFKAIFGCFLLWFAAGGDPPQKAKLENASRNGERATLTSASMDKRSDPDAPAIDAEAEARLLEIANRDRLAAGLAPLEIHQGLTEAARNHALAMADARQLSHQLAGEAGLSNRVASITNLRLDEVGENVALDTTVASAQKHLMQSPPHRRNLLDPDFNVAGFAVVRAGGQLYVVQDFAHRLEPMSLHQTEALVADAVNQWRLQRGLHALTAVASPEIRDAACGLAQANTLKTKTIKNLSQRQAILTYTQSKPEALPDDAARVLSGERLKRASIGVCFARSATYPSGVYWVALGFE
jgi:uncharacterized protein YkwD